MPAVKFVLHGAAHEAVQIVKRAQLTDEYGYDGLFFGESQWNTLDPFQSLVLCATKTKTITLGTGVTSMLFRSPLQLANAAVTLNHISNGRAILGVGTGDEPELGMKSTRMDKFEYELKRIRQLLHGGSLHFRSLDGKDIEESLVVGTVPVPLYISAEGPRTMQLAGRVADGVILGTGFDLRVFRWAKDKISQGAREADRSADDIEILVSGMVVVGKDGDRARNLVRRRIANRAYHNFRSTLETVPKEEIAGVQKFIRAFDITKPIEEKVDPNFVNDYLTQRFAVAGTAEECKMRIEELVKAGARGFMLTPPFSIFEEIMKEWARSVMVNFAKS
ncbi:MAG: LLM class flavin-dependent oxidoreductase [Nitrososphaerales archaeon]